MANIAELLLGDSLARGDKGPGVRRVQEWLNLTNKDFVLL